MPSKRIKRNFKRSCISINANLNSIDANDANSNSIKNSIDANDTNSKSIDVNDAINKKHSKEEKEKQFYESFTNLLFSKELHEEIHELIMKRLGYRTTLLLFIDKSLKARQYCNAIATLRIKYPNVVKGKWVSFDNTMKAIEVNKRLLKQIEADFPNLDFSNTTVICLRKNLH